jgi:hypothetical protein
MKRKMEKLMKDEEVDEDEKDEEVYDDWKGVEVDESRG